MALSSSSSSSSSVKRSWLSIAIWTSLIVALANGDSYELKKRSNKESIGYAIKAKTESRQPRFIKIDDSPGKIDMDLELSIPFISIPLQDKSTNPTGGVSMPLVKINRRSFMMFGALMGIATFIGPLLSKLMSGKLPHPANMYNRPHYAKEHKRTDRGLDFTNYIEDSINDILDGNNTLAPCLERLVCSAVATAKTADEPNNLDKIVDALSSNELFERAVNGTVIKDAASKGREVLSAEDCATTYTDCAFNQKILLNVLKMIGL